MNTILESNPGLTLIALLIQAVPKVPTKLYLGVAVAIIAASLSAAFLGPILISLTDGNVGPILTFIISVAIAAFAITPFAVAKR